MKSAIVKTIVSVLPLILVFCAGNGSEIPTQVGGDRTEGQCVILSSAADSAIIVAFPRQYNDPNKQAQAPDTVYADINGRFSIKLGDSAHNLLVYDKSRTLGAFVPIANDSSLGKIRLDTLGSISGSFSRDSLRWIAYVGIIGSPFKAFAANGLFKLDGLPPFDYQLSAWGLPPAGCTPGKDCHNAVPDSAMGSITVAPGKTSSVEFGK